MMVLGLQEITQVLDKPDNVELAQQVKTSLKAGFFDYDERNIFGTGWLQREQRITEMKSADSKVVMDSIRAIPFRHMAREFLASSGTTGISGAIYMIPTKVYQVMFDSAVEEDHVAWLSINGSIIPADQIGGTTMNVAIAEDGSYVVKPFSSGGQASSETIKTVQATLDFSTVDGINFPITNDLIEDSQFDVMEMHMRNAGREIGEYAFNKALTVLKTATDGDGTLNGGASGDADETKFTGATTFDYKDIHQAVLDDGYLPNKIVGTPQAWYHSVVATAYTTTNQDSAPWNYNAIVDGPAKKILGCEVKYSTVNTLTNDKAMTNCVTIMFDDRYALLTGRKRWLRIENYSEPVRDLVGAVVTMRQDSVTIYNDSIAIITED